LGAYHWRIGVVLPSRGDNRRQPATKCNLCVTCVYNLRYVHTSSPCGCEYIRIYAHRVYMCGGIDLHICTLSLHVCWYMSLHIGTPSIHVGGYTFCMGGGRYPWGCSLAYVLLHRRSFSSTHRATRPRLNTR